jgi:hypothetical protein
MGEDFWESSAQEGNLGGLQNRKWKQMKHSGSTCHRFGGPFHEGRLLGACEQPLALLIWESVNLSSYIAKDFWNILNFIKNGRRANFLNKGMGVCTEACDEVWIFQQIILGFREELSEEGSFPCSSGTCENQPQKMFRS